MTDLIRDVRREYKYATLSSAEIAKDPLDQFKRWMGEAEKAEIQDVTAMALATSDAQGQPTVRIVLLKGFDEAGFSWFSDGGSEKGQALAANPRAELLFHWRELDRQIRIRGSVVALSAAEADAYFYSRPLASQLAAATSQQSQPVDSRHELEQRYKALAAQHTEQAPRPQAWGGFKLRPEAYEFWQGREGRLHDRLQFKRDVEQHWQMQRLQP
ncbi:MAG: pyridoxamine 5'-phosphate oxidase [Gammaproteobacteria bacterium]|jgi:pyridoxamine 5'-phosphate oxidase|nr:pyridoxamine 5'-phosphate oxidase [Gammaproteobacteria bacterium]MBT3695601.1 pyridoxamine 5'-phosphate oxidase [Gammaproteobacteria bacterium]MBT5683036.1 pyridoxamine 5'-phosphate oxidase [Gammaproteobacteria bacterium]MBT6558124.1 pyridoxamine 5'-phosphate oxidase [Gammaproteobacteria bacterium]